MNRLKNIIIVNDTANINGGAANVAIRSAIALAEQNYQVFFFAAAGPVCDELKKSMVQVKCLEMDDINHGSRVMAFMNGIWNKKAKKEFESFLSSFSAQETIVHIHGWSKALSSSVVKAAQKSHFKIVVTLHDYFSVCPNGGFYDYQQQEICHRIPMSWSCIRCNCDKRSYSQKLWRVARQQVQDRYIRYNPDLYYISISDKNENNIKPYATSEHFCRIDNPVNLANQKAKEGYFSNLFLYAGRLSEEKGIDLFCQAVTELKKRKSIEGIVLGDGEMLDKLKEQYPALRYEGWKSNEEVKQYILLARVLVLPSRWYEGAPLSIIEAMSAGVPCIVSDCTSATEIISDGIDGFVFKSGDINSLIQKMEEALNDQTLGKIRAGINEYFSLGSYKESVHAENLIQYYSSIMGQ